MEQQVLLTVIGFLCGLVISNFKHKKNIKDAEKEHPRKKLVLNRIIKPFLRTDEENNHLTIFLSEKYERGYFTKSEEIELIHRLLECEWKKLNDEELAEALAGFRSWIYTI
jgi:hypothetical protein